LVKDPPFFGNPENKSRIASKFGMQSALLPEPEILRLRISEHPQKRIIFRQL
jgi:hypothetical protein